MSWRALLALALALPAWLPAAAPALPALGDNGHALVTRKRQVPLRCLDAPQFLAMEGGAQAQLIERAAKAGFNAISFEAPLFGPSGLIPHLDRLTETASNRFIRGFLALRSQGLYAVPVLHTPASARALIGPERAPVVFFGGTRALAWQRWGLARLCSIKHGPWSLARDPGIAAWILYRGPWPDSEPVQGRAPKPRPSAEDYLSQWAGQQVKVLRKLGLKQPLGLGLWPKEDIGQRPAARAALDAAGPAPLAPLSSAEAPPSITAEQAQALDALPAVPGTGREELASPWDLEGLDWDAVEALFENLPLRSQVDLLEFSLDTEDWARVGKRLAAAAAKAEVPVLWRQDWGKASRYERAKHLEPPQPLAGLVGSWPEEDWPEPEEPLWQDELPEALQPLPFKPTQLKLVREGGKVVMELSLSHPGQVLVEYGRGYPFEREAEGGGQDALEHRILLPGLQGPQPFLFRLRLKGPQGLATLRARWAKPPR